MTERINLTEIEARMAAVRKSGYSDAAVVGLIHHDLPAIVAWVREAREVLKRARDYADLAFATRTCALIDALLSRLEEKP